MLIVSENCYEDLCGWWFRLLESTRRIGVLGGVTHFQSFQRGFPSVEFLTAVLAVEPESDARCNDSGWFGPYSSKLSRAITLGFKARVSHSSSPIFGVQAFDRVFVRIHVRTNAINGH